MKVYASIMVPVWILICLSHFNVHVFEPLDRGNKYTNIVNKTEDTEYKFIAFNFIFIFSIIYINKNNCK